MHGGRAMAERHERVRGRLDERGRAAHEDPRALLIGEVVVYP